MLSRSAPGASPRPPRTPTGRPLSLPGSPGEVPEHVFHQKLCQNGAKWMKNGICHGFSKSPRIFITFCMDFGSFSVVFFVAFFGRAFSKKCRCCKVRHARILWFLQWILTISTFHVFLAKAKKTEIPARISMQKTSEIQCRISLKIRCKKNMEIHEKSMKIDTRKPTFEKRGSEVRFLMDLSSFWGSVGGPK